MGWFSSDKDPKQKKVTERKKNKIKKKISKAQERKLKKLGKSGWGRAKLELSEETNTEYSSLYYGCGVHNVNAYTPWQHDEICGG